MQITPERDYTHYPASPSPSSGGRAAAASASEDVSDGAGGWDYTAPSLVALLRMDEDEWDAFSRGRPIRRAKRAGFLRHVAVALGNWGAPEAVPALIDALGEVEGALER